jgi:hypothetical protein
VNGGSGEGGGEAGIYILILKSKGEWVITDVGRWAVFNLGLREATVWLTLANW